MSVRPREKCQTPDRLVPKMTPDKYDDGEWEMACNGELVKPFSYA